MRMRLAGSTGVVVLAVLAAGCTSSNTAAPTPSAAPVSSASIAATGVASSPAASSVTSPAGATSGTPASVAGSAAVGTTSAPTGTAATTEAAPGGPTLRVSTASGPPGTVVRISISDCPAPAGGYTGFFADSHALATPDDATLRRPLTITAGAAETATASYSVTSRDAKGGGIFEVQCGANANATTAFTVLN
jgi:hypothetical protein